MALLLFLEPLFQRLHQLVPAPERLDLALFLLGEIALGHQSQPILRNLRGDVFAHRFDPLEDMAEGPVEFIKIAFVFHKRRTGEVVEILHPPVRQIGVHRLHQGEIFP